VNNPIIAYCYSRVRWGRWLHETLRERGMEAHRFHSAAEVPDRPGVIAYLPPTHRAPHRDHIKALAHELGNKRHVLLIPSLEEMRLYDDKAAQAEVFREWQPETRVLCSRDQARAVLPSLELPFVSKSSHGIASQNVRLIRTRDQGEGEIRAAFSWRGMPCGGGERQRGYLIWQDFVRGNDFDWRVLVLGSAKVWAKPLRRFNRPEVPFASGSGRIEEVSELTSEVVGVLDHSLQFAREFDLRHTALDLVRAPDGRLLILESSAKWQPLESARRYPSDSVYFRRTADGWARSEHTAGSFYDLLADMMMDGAFRRLLVEKATEEDRPAVLRLLEQANMHHIPSPEMPNITYENYFVARFHGDVVGFSGYKQLSDTTAKTELMVVDRAGRGQGVGLHLQERRMEDMLARGIRTLTTNADLPATISWYRRHFGYRKVGKLKKVHEFGDPAIDHWTTLQVDLVEWDENRRAAGVRKAPAIHGSASRSGPARGPWQESAPR
jgi:ribosomal-protein-alanine N-acetyltransferase